ncbi:MAG TPA: hypothetical protein VF785_19075 [Gemmatimonadaceae bacterium]
MPLTRAIKIAAAGTMITVAAACHGARQAESVSQAPEHALSGLARQHIIILPTYAFRVGPGLDWGAAAGRPSDVQRTLDTDIKAALEERGLDKTWIFPAQLEQSYKRNSTYAADPYTLAEEPLRSPMLAADARLPEPLASQVRTLVALHDEVRLVLAPVELRLEKAGTSGGRGVLRVVLLDARTSNVLWIGQVAGDSAAAFGPVITASLAARFANVVAP